MIKKIKNKKGVTLTELLVATVIMAFVFLVSISSIGSSTGVYKEVTAKNAAQTYLTENMTRMAAALRFIDYETSGTGEDAPVYIVRDAAGNIEKYVFTSLKEGYRGYFDNDNGIIRFRSTINPDTSQIVALNNTDAALYAEFSIDPESTETLAILTVTIRNGSTADAGIGAQATMYITPLEIILKK